MNILIGSYAAIIGLCVGSFVNAYIYRLITEESIAHGRSHCTVCNRSLKWYELIPVISYLIQRGKCRGCGSKVSALYPIGEILMAVLFVSIYHGYGLSVAAARMAVLVTLTLVVAAVDFKTGYVYVSTVLIGAVIGVVTLGFYVNSLQVVYNSLLGMALGFVVPYLFYLLSRGQLMGKGDSYIVAMAGLFTDWAQVIFILFVAFVTGGIYGIIVLTTKKHTMKDSVPFGPFLAIGIIASVLFGGSAVGYFMLLLH